MILFIPETVLLTAYLKEEARNRIQIEVVTGRGGSQILLEDPAGNPIELFQPAGA